MSAPHLGKQRTGTQKESPWDRANLFSKYSFSFMLPLFRRKELDLDDLPGPPRAQQSRALGLRLQQAYNEELLGGRKPSLVRALFKLFWLRLLVCSLADLLSKCLFYPLQTVALGWLIRDTSLYLLAAEPGATDEAYWRIVLDAGLMVLFTMLALVLAHPFFFETSRLGMECRVAACHLVYRKALRLSQAALSETTIGQMVNLLSNDVNRFDQVAQMLPYLVLAPLQACVVLALLAGAYLGVYPTLAGLSTVLLYVALQTAMGRGFSRFRARTAQRTDERVRLMNEIILAMRIIKMYAWERPFKQLVRAARRREVTSIGLVSLLRTINLTLFFVSSKIIVFVALLTYVLLGRTFKPEIVFVSIGLANLVRISLTLFFPNAVSYSAETLVSCKRLNAFLQLPEIEYAPALYKAAPDAYGCRYALQLRSVYASWPAKTSSGAGSEAIIRNLSLAVRARDLVLVVGRVGSGKSSLLMALLGELPLAAGQLEVNGRIAYASQEAWILPGTVRDNILFGRPLEQERYQEVLRVCSLERDLAILVAGDNTVVGERGVSLSGGQKARVNLARALYGQADLYLLDDPLAAVDAPVAKHIFNECLRTFLRDKTLVLATHQLQFLRHASKVLVLDRELPAAFGTLQEVMDSAAFAAVDYSKEAFEDATTTDAATTDIDERLSRRRQLQRSRSRSSGADSPAADPLLAPSPGEESVLVRAESRASSNLAESVGSLSLVSERPKKPVGSERRHGTETSSGVSSNCSTYRYYLSSAAGPLMLTWFLLTNLATQSFYLYTDFFLSSWTDSVQRRELQGAQFEPLTYVDRLDNGQVSGLYGLLVGLCFLSALCRAGTFFAGTLRASINVHNRLFESLVQAPMRFFDFSPIGVLLNRLSRDIGFIDETLPATTIEIVTIFVNISGIIVLTLLLDYKNAGACLLLLLIAFGLRRLCARTITRLKQLEGVARSPVFSHLSTTLAGLATVRVSRAQEQFMRAFDRLQDEHSGVWFTYICSTRWLTVAMDWLCLGFIGLVAALLVALSLDATTASLVGLLISQIVVLPGPFQWGVRQLIEAESQMTSVQRVKEFSELAPEPDEGATRAGLSDSELLLSYRAGGAIMRPEEGEIRFNSLTLSYFADEPPVLRGLSFTVRAREKVGVVGRTGAGKSSIVAALFRLYEFEGSIEIDGRDTRTVPLGQLRRSMSIIPQDPVLFGGTLRKNLDPFGEHLDADLWAALEAVQLGQLFRRHAHGLELLVSEAGANMSVGQRQLICLARAIVRRNRILVLDEATANVDPETDAFIQRTIARQFAHCTVLTIAHRLVTIVDSDRVLVLERGKLREFAPPYQLLQNRASLFAKMVDSSAQQAPRLRKLIEEHHNRRLAQQKQQ